MRCPLTPTPHCISPCSILHKTNLPTLYSLSSIAFLSATEAMDRTYINRFTVDVVVVVVVLTMNIIFSNRPLNSSPVQFGSFMVLQNLQVYRRRPVTTALAKKFQFQYVYFYRVTQRYKITIIKSYHNHNPRILGIPLTPAKKYPPFCILTNQIW